MAYFPVPGDLLAVRSVCFTATDSQLSVNVFHYVVQNVVGGGLSQTAIATNFDTLLAAVYKAFMGSQAAYHGIGVTKILPIPRVVEEIGNAGAGPGSAGSGLLPEQTSGLIKFLTANAGRKFRGRCYPGFPYSGFADANGNLNAAGIIALGNITAAIPLNPTFVSGGANVTLFQAIYHRALGTGSQVFNKVTVSQFATQRRRGQLGRTNIAPF